jgi:hypothetical protein
MQIRLLAIASIIFVNSAWAVDYGGLMTKKVSAVLGKQTVKGYVFASYPLDNYGLATAYEGKVNAAKQLCATWDCLGINDDSAVAKLTEDQRFRLVVDGIQFASVGGGADLKLTEDEKKSLALNAIIPKLLQVLKIDVDFSKSNEVKTELSVGPIAVRTLRRKEMMDKLGGPKAHTLEKAAYEAGNLVLVYSDIVISSIKLDINADPQMGVTASAKLSGALDGKVGQIIGADASLGFKLSSSTKGHYVLESAKPLILAVYTRKQPTKKVLGKTDWNDWANFDLGSTNPLRRTSIELGDLK